MIMIYNQKLWHTKSRSTKKSQKRNRINSIFHHHLIRVNFRVFCGDGMKNCANFLMIRSDRTQNCAPSSFSDLYRVDEIIIK